MKFAASFLLVLASTANGFVVAPVVARSHHNGVVVSKAKPTSILQVARFDLPPEEKEEKDAPSRDTKFGWEKNLPKKSLAPLGQSHTASQWLLNLIEGTHWLAFIPTFMSCFAIMKYHDVWYTMFDGDSLRVVLWLVAPMIQMGAGVAPIISHVYEDWQVAPSKDPAADSGVYSPDIYMNQHMREISYSLLFTGLGLSGTMAAHAYQGWATSLAPVALSAGVFAYACLGDKKNLVTEYVTPLLGKNIKAEAAKGISLVPVPVSNMVFFVYSQMILWLFALLPLASQVDDLGLKALILIPQALATAAGILEGFEAETKFDQRYHLLASSCMCLGATLQASSFFQLGEYFS